MLIVHEFCDRATLGKYCKAMIFVIKTGIGKLGLLPILCHEDEKSSDI